MPPTKSPEGATPNTDEKLRVIFAEITAGFGQSLTWGMKYVYPTEQIFAWIKNHPGQQRGFVKKVAHFYASTLGEGVPSLPRFAADFDRWAAATTAVKSVKTFGKRDDSKLGAPSVARAAHGWCKIHPGRAATSAAGLCGECRDDMTKPEANDAH